MALEQESALPGADPLPNAVSTRVAEGLVRRVAAIEALTGMDCVVALGLGLVPVSVIESVKLLRRVPLTFGPRLRRTAE